MFCCGGPPSRAQPMSRSRIGEVFNNLIGMLLSLATWSGSVFMRMTNWVWPNLARPDGRVRVSALTWVSTCIGVSP